jgi:DNA-binding NarL/FixJ family response regulator
VFLPKLNAFEPCGIFLTTAYLRANWWFVEKIRVVIGYESRLVRELVRGIISRHTDFDVVGEIQEERGILPAIEQDQPDCLILEQGKSDRRPAICDSVFRRFPHMKILTVASGSEESTLYWVSTEICSARIETSEEGVLNALRSKVGSR